MEPIKGDLGGIQHNGMMYVSLPVIAHVWNIPVETIIHELHQTPLAVCIVDGVVLIAQWDCFAVWGVPRYTIVS